MKLPAGLFATVTSAAVSSARSPRGLRTSFIDIQRSAVNIRSVERSDSFVGFARIAHFDKCKTSSLSRVAIRHDVHPINAAVSFKKRTNLLFACREAEVS